MESTAQSRTSPSLLGNVSAPLSPPLRFPVLSSRDSFSGSWVCLHHITAVMLFSCITFLQVKHKHPISEHCAISTSTVVFFCSSQHFPYAHRDGADPEQQCCAGCWAGTG